MLTESQITGAQGPAWELHSPKGAGMGDNLVLPSRSINSLTLGSQQPWIILCWTVDTNLQIHSFHTWVPRSIILLFSPKLNQLELIAKYNLFPYCACCKCLDRWLIFKIWGESSFCPNLTPLILQTLFYAFIPYKKISHYGTKPYILSERLDFSNEKLATSLWIKFSKYLIFLCNILLFIFLTGNVSFPMIFTKFHILPFKDSLLSSRCRLCACTTKTWL